MCYLLIAILIQIFATIISQIADKGSNGISYMIGLIVGCIFMVFLKDKE